LPPIPTFAPSTSWPSSKGHLRPRKRRDGYRIDLIIVSWQVGTADPKLARVD
jgi:hypothetical protein